MNSNDVLKNLFQNLGITFDFYCDFADRDYLKLVFHYCPGTAEPIMKTYRERIYSEDLQEAENRISKKILLEMMNGYYRTDIPHESVKNNLEEKLCYGVFYNSIEYPGQFVIRRFDYSTNPPLADPKPYWIGDSYQLCREAIPAGLIPFPRQLDDDRSLIEAWI